MVIPMPLVGSAAYSPAKSVDPTLPRSALTSRLKTIDRRRSEIEALLNLKKPTDKETHHSLELRTELANLNALRRGIDEILHPVAVKEHAHITAAKAKQWVRDLANLKAMIRQQREHLEWNIEREAAAGSFGQARLLREQLLTLPEDICAEYKLDLSLLEELE